jgi:hypothetical protein
MPVMSEAQQLQVCASDAAYQILIPGTFLLIILRQTVWYIRVLKVYVYVPEKISFIKYR